MRFARLALLSTPALLASLTLFWGCGEDAEGSTSQREINGVVRDAQSGRGIAEAIVELTSDALDTAETSSDGEGRFSLHIDLSAGVAFGHVNARHRDYESAAATSVYFDGAENVLSIELRRKPGK